MSFLSKITRPLALILALSALALSGCGQKAETLEGKEGARIDLDGLVYQVQLSRQLNPKDVGDEQLTVGQLPTTRKEVLYGVFMRVENEESDKPLRAVPAQNMKIVDAGGVEYKPLDASKSALVYEPITMIKGDRIPVPDSAADNGPTKGSLILFKISLDSMENRPLILEIKGLNGRTGAVRLDI
ncbi:MAG: hypothetical protein JHC87_05265 [Thermoleophilaceae bacterium]|nr:hypothetical protein [Thermoleophilaceae bacterium]